MKHILLSLFTFLCFLSNSFAQNDRITELSQLVGEEVYLFDIKSIALSNGKFVFVHKDGKLKAIPQKEIFGGKDVVQLKCKELVNIKNKTYVRCSFENVEYYLFINPKKDSYLNKFRSISYWYRYLEENKDSHAYLYTPNNSAARLTDQYAKHNWLYPHVPSTKIDDEVSFYVNIDAYKENRNVTSTKFVTLTKFETPVGGSVYKSQKDYDNAVKEQARLDSIQEVKDQQQDMIPVPAICIKEYSYGEKDFEHTNEGDTAYVYFADKSNISLCTGYTDITLGNMYYEFVNPNQRSFLEKRGKRNIEGRKAVANEAAEKWWSEELQRAAVKMKEIMAAIDAREKEIRTKQLFLKDVDYEYGDYGDFGMSFSIHNCFKKTIKYIEFTCTPYNSVGDIQPDWVGKRISKTKGIGPLEPGESASWKWDDLFYDKNDIIKKVRLTGIKFLFSDGSSLSFSGWQNIKKHTF